MVYTKFDVVAYKYLRSVADDNHAMIKQILTEALVKEMISSKSILFTKIENHAAGTTHCYARCFMCPDETVKLLKTHKFIK